MYIVIVQPPPAVMRRAAATKEKAVSRIVLCGRGGLLLLCWQDVGWVGTKSSLWETERLQLHLDLDDFSALDKVAEQDGQSDDRHAC